MHSLASRKFLSPYRTRTIVRAQCKPSFMVDNMQKITQDSISFAAKPITDILERIDHRLANIELELKTRYADKTDGSYIKMLPPDEAQAEPK